MLSGLLITNAAGQVVTVSMLLASVCVIAGAAPSRPLLLDPTQPSSALKARPSQLATHKHSRVFVTPNADRRSRAGTVETGPFLLARHTSTNTHSTVRYGARRENEDTANAIIDAPMKE